MDHVLRRAARVVLHDKSVSLGQLTYAVTGLMPFITMTMLRCVVAVSILLARGDVLPYLPPLLANAGSQRTTRNSDARRFAVPHYTLTATEGCFYYKAAIYWNALASTIMSIESH